MRTTIDIPDRDHARFVALARERGISLSKLLVELADNALEPDIERGRSMLRRSQTTGFLTVQSGRTITHEEVKRLLEDET